MLCNLILCNSFDCGTAPGHLVCTFKPYMTTEATSPSIIPFQDVFIKIFMFGKPGAVFLKNRQSRNIVTPGFHSRNFAGVIGPMKLDQQIVFDKLLTYYIKIGRNTIFSKI